MTDNVGHIKNPLTVISRFAAVAEISGTAVLPFIAPENQATYIWFLMLFPTLLVAAFFLTLNYNHKTLYAPSDYQNQNHFLNLFGIVTSDERDKKLSEEVVEANTPLTDSIVEAPDKAHDAPTTPSPTAPPQVSDSAQLGEPSEAREASVETEGETSPPPMEPDLSIEIPEANFDFEDFAKRSKKESMMKLQQIEKQAIEKLRSSTNIVFSEAVKFDIPNIKQPIIFDAIADQNETIHIAEVKYFDKNGFSLPRFNATFQDAYIAAKNIYSASNRKVLLHLIVVLDKKASAGTYHNIRIALTNAAATFSLPIKVYITTTDLLGSESDGWIINQ